MQYTTKQTRGLQKVCIIDAQFLPHSTPQVMWDVGGGIGVILWKWGVKERFIQTKSSEEYKSQVWSYSQSSYIQSHPNFLSNIFEEKNNFWLTEMYIQPSFALLLISTLIGHCSSETEEAPYKVENSWKNVNAPTTIINSRALRFAILQKSWSLSNVPSDFATNLTLF